METKFAIIDVETTGGRASQHKITEIAIAIHDGNEVIEEFETLLNPEMPIPYGITELTGITNDMVADAPKFYEVAKKIVEITEGAIFVAHNVRFDYSFVQEEFRRLGFTFSRKKLCTVRLAKQAFPGYRSYSLGNLITTFGLNAGPRHRAMGDVIATVDLFERCLGVETTEGDIKKMVNLGVKEALLPEALNMEKLHALPEECGVYYFHDEAGNVVYIGKSINIKKRIAEHFSVKTEKARKLQAAVHDVSFEITGSEMVSLLYESHLIKKERPPINRAQKVRQFPYVIHAFKNEEGYLCFEVKKTSVKARKDLQVVATYPKQANAKAWLRGVQKRYELCLRHCHLEVKKGACFDYHLSKCHGACVGIESPEDYNERAREAIGALDENFEHPNFFLIDKGRTPTENSIVLVEDGEYRGFGFAELSELNGDIEELKDYVEPKTHNPEVMRILQRFLAKPKSGMRFIKF